MLNLQLKKSHSDHIDHNEDHVVEYLKKKKHATYTTYLVFYLSRPNVVYIKVGVKAVKRLSSKKQENRRDEHYSCVGAAIN